MLEEINKIQDKEFRSRCDYNKLLDKLAVYNKDQAVADARQRAHQALEQNDILRQQVQNAQDEIKLLTDIKEIPQKYRGMLIKMWREHNYKFEIKDYYVAVREKQEYKAKLTNKIQQCAKLQSEIMTLKTAYAPPCASSSMLQETGLETTDTWDS